jgi:AraC-like DNA-binding protein
MEFVKAMDGEDGISAVWALPVEGRPVSTPRYAFADGCSYLLFGFGAAQAGWRELLHARLVGPRTVPFIIDQRPRLCVGIRFAPGFARLAFGLEGTELLNRRVEYEAVFPGLDGDFERIKAATTDGERVGHALALARRRFRSATRVPRSLRAALAHITAALGNVRVGRLANHLGVTRQHLARQFATHVGMTAKQFARIKRVEAARARALSQHAAPRRVSWSMIAQELGYYDQAHFIGDFKVSTGSTPGAWLR